MAWLNDYRVGIVKLKAASNHVSSITQSSLQANVEIEKQMTSGSPYPMHAIVNTARPVASFTTMAIDDAVTELGFTSQCAVDVELYLQLRTCDASNVVNGLIYTMPNALIVPTSLSVNHRGNAEMSYDIYARSADGVVEPVTVASTVAFPASGAQKRFTMDKASVGATGSGVVFEGKRSINMNWNPDITQEGADSTVFDTVVSVASEQHVVTFRGVEQSWFSTVAPTESLIGGKGDRSDTLFYLKDRDQPTGAGQSHHILVSMDALVSWNTIFDGSADSPAESEMQWDAYVKDQTSEAIPISIQTGQDIT